MTTRIGSNTTKPSARNGVVSGNLHAWWLAIRPKTLTLSLAPVLVGTTLAWAHTGTLQTLPFAATLLTTLLIQIGTNLHNDVADYRRGADTPDRLGPKRATAQGWLSPEQVLGGARLSLGIAFLFGAYLVWVGGWPILALGLLSLCCAVAYTGGPRPIAYSVTGEVFVFVFFGLAAVGGSYYLQTLQMHHSALLAGAALGTPAAAVLLVNNYRDRQTDRRVGKITLAGAIGRPTSKMLYAILLLAPFAFLPLLFDGMSEAGLWLPYLLLPRVFHLIVQFRRTPPGPPFNRILAHTAQFQLAFSALLSLGLLL